MEGLPNNKGSILSKIFSLAISKKSGFFASRNLIIPEEGILYWYLKDLVLVTVTPRSFSVIAELFLNSSEDINSLYNFGFSFFKDSSNITLYKSSPS